MGTLRNNSSEAAVLQLPPLVPKSGRGEWSSEVTFEPTLPVNVVTARLRLIINACFDNFQTKLTVLRIACQEGLQFEETITFQEFYQLVDQAFKLDRSLPYEIYATCARGWFDQFGQLLAKRLGTGQDQSTAISGQVLINYWNQILGNVLPYIGQAFMGMERVMRQDRSSKMLLTELTGYLFFGWVIEKQPLLQTYLQEAIHGTIYQRYQLILKGLAMNCTVDELKTKIVARQSDQLNLCIGLIAMLGALDPKYQALLVKVPLLRHTLPDFLLNADFDLNVKGVPTYCENASKFIQLQHWLLEQLHLKEPRATRLCRHLLFCHQLPMIVTHTMSGVNQLLEKQQYHHLAKIGCVIQEQLEGADSCADVQVNLKQRMLDFFKSHLESESSLIAAKFPVTSRQQSLTFARKILDQRKHWTKVTEQCFVSYHFKAPIENIVNQCFGEMIRVCRNSAHALAYYFHDLMLRESFTLASYPATEWAQQRHELFLDLIQSHIGNLGREINQFYDYTKHYFVRRLMCQSGALPPEQELETFLELLNHAINYKYVKLRDGSQPMFFTQNFNDFKLILTEYKKLFKASASGGRKFLEQLSAMHAGIFKYIDFEQCTLGQTKMVRSFRDAKRTYERRNAQKKVILNTRYSAALISCLWVQPQPVEVWVNLNQMAIVGVFESRDLADYRTIQQETGFRKEIYLQLAMLSLIYAGLLEVTTTRKRNPSLEHLRFELKSTFDPKSRTDLRHLDEVDFATARPPCELFETVVQLITDGADLYFRCAEMLVQELDLNHIISAPSSPSTIASSNSRQPSVGTIASFNTPELRNRTRVTRRMTRNNTLAFQDSPGSSGLSSPIGPRPSLGPCIERVIKIEAALVRVLKKNRTLPNLRTIHSKLEQEIARFLPPNEDGQPEPLTIDEVQRVLLKLIEKKYVERGPTGAFCYLLS